MKKKSIFTKAIIVICAAMICLIITLSIAFLFGSVNADLFDFSNLNISNMLPIILIGGFISCFIVGILIILLAKDVFMKAKNYLFETNQEEETKK